MPDTAYRFIEPLDVLFLRGNKLFGDPGSHGESLVPPWPSVAAGALRSLMLAADGVDIADFAKGALTHPALGTPAAPGSFELSAFDLARRRSDGAIETLHALPADLVLSAAGGKPLLSRVQPVEPAEGLVSSAPLERWPVLPQSVRSKPDTGRWLTQAGWAEHLLGRMPTAEQLVTSGELWQLDARVGIGLDKATGRADDGKLFSLQAVAFRRGVGFLVAVRGAEPPHNGVLRFGGDGRGAAMHAVIHAPAQPDLEAIAQARRCRIVLTTPGLFDAGWLPADTTEELRLELHGVTGRLVCAAVPRPAVVSGWDLAHARPKPAQRVAPAGSVYWIDALDATAEQLGKLAARGLWPAGQHNAARRAEGFNRFTFATY
jgi:CRISPR-associated protein Cmr3